MSLSKTIIKSALSNYTGFLVSALVSLFISPIIVHHLGKTAYGLWALFQSVFGYFGLLEVGLGVSVVKYISQFKSEKDQHSINIFGSTIFFTFTVIGVFAILLSFGFAFLATTIFKIPFAYNRIAFYGIIIGGFTTAITFSMTFFINNLAAHQRYDLVNIIGITRSLIYAASVITLLRSGFGLLSLFMLNFCLSVMTLIIGYLIVVLKYKFIKLKLHLFSLQMLKLAYKYSIFAFLNNISGQILLNIGNVIIGTVLTVEFITYYALSLKIVSAIMQTISSIVWITLPVFSGFWAVHDKEKIRITYLEITKTIILISLPISMVVVLYSKHLMALWIGPGYNLAALSLICLTLVLFIHYIGGYISGVLLFGIGKHKALSIANAIAAVANIILALVLTKLIDIKFGAGYGILGIPVALGLSMGAVDLFFLPWYVNKIIELPNKAYIKNLIRPVLFIIPALIVALFIKHYYVPRKLIVFILESAIIGFTYWGLYYQFGLTRDEKTRYLGYVKQFVGRS